MRPLEQYVTLRRGREVLRKQADEEWAYQATLPRKWYFQLTRWLGIRLITWGHKLQQVGMIGDFPPL